MTLSDQSDVLSARIVRRAILKALQARRSSASHFDIANAVGDSLNLTKAERDSIINRVRAARADLETVKVLKRTDMNAWDLTDYGRSATFGDVEARLQQERLAREDYDQAWSELRYGTAKEPAAALKEVAVLQSESVEAERKADAPTPEALSADCVDQLKQIPHDEFELFTRDLLKALEYQDVRITGRGRDGGIDGHATIRQPLNSVPIVFQCKRYRGTVSAPEIQKFRGAIDGHNARGLFVTTGRFTADAKQEAQRSGALPIDLIDGVELCRQVEKLGWKPQFWQGDSAPEVRSPTLFDHFEDSQ